MNKTLLYAMGLILMIALTTSGCKKCDDPTDPECPNYCVDETNPACPNYDPCWDQGEVSAEFRIIEDGSFTTQLVVFDTVYYDTVLSTTLISEALNVRDDWTYTWYIGSETYDGPLRSLDYSSAPKGVPITITLVVEGPPNAACFPGDDGRDTVSRGVVFKPNETNSSFFQSLFFGYFNGDPQDTVTLSISADRSWLMANFKRGCSSSSYQAAGTFRSFYFVSKSSNKCDHPFGIMIRDPEKTGDFERVEARYTLQSDGNTIDMLFEGRRVR